MRRHLPAVAAFAAIWLISLNASADVAGGIVAGTDWLITILRAAFVIIIVITLISIRSGHNVMEKVGLTALMIGGIAEAPTIAGWFG